MPQYMDEFSTDARTMFAEFEYLKKDGHESPRLDGLSFNIP